MSKSAKLDRVLAVIKSMFVLRGKKPKQHT